MLMSQHVQIAIFYLFNGAAPDLSTGRLTERTVCGLSAKLLDPSGSKHKATGWSDDSAVGIQLWASPNAGESIEEVAAHLQ